MTTWDRLLVVGVVCLAVAFLPATLLAAGSSDGELVVKGPSGRTVISLSEDSTSVVQGRVGKLTVVVHEGTVRVSHAECPNQVCVRSGSISASRGSIVCAPNGVVITLQDSGRSGLDSISR